MMLRKHKKNYADNLIYGGCQTLKSLMVQEEQLKKFLDFLIHLQVVLQLFGTVRQKLYINGLMNGDLKDWL